MDFLPITIEDKKVYASFSWRLYAYLIDGLLYLPIIIILIWLQGKSLKLAYILTIPIGLLWVTYFIIFNTIYGGTIGKFKAKIRITKPDGSKINFIAALKRSSVELIFVFLFVYVALMALTYVVPEHFILLDWVQRSTKLQEHFPSWYKYIKNISSIWIISEIIVLLFNKRYRTLHDYIAGTVVIHEQFRK